jgi:hypothetical protein
MFSWQIKHILWTCLTLSRRAAKLKVKMFEHIEISSLQHRIRAIRMRNMLSNPLSFYSSSSLEYIPTATCYNEDLTDNPHEHQSSAMSELPYHSCKACVKEIKSEAIQSSEMLYHPDCFSCFSCSSFLYNEVHFTRQDNIYCEACHTKNFGAHCKLCREIISGEAVLIGTSSFHAETCAKCAVCKQSVKNYQTMSLTLDGILLCQDCEKI